VSLLVSGLTVLTAVALLPLFRDLTQAALAAIVISAVVGFLNLPALRRTCCCSTARAARAPRSSAGSRPATST
jgi:hypothetical protein